MMSLPYSHNHTFPTPLPPPALPKSSPPIIEPSIIVADVKKEIDKQSDKISNNDMVKTYFESKTHGLLIDHQKSNLDLFKVIQALLSIETKIETLATSVGDLCKVTTELNGEITRMNKLNDDMNKSLDEMKKKPMPTPVAKSSAITRSPSMMSVRPNKK